MYSDFLDSFMSDRGITEQNQEVMGSKEQVFPRYANPADGTLTFGGPEAEGPGHVLRDGDPDPRMRGPLFPGDIENMDFEFHKELKKMLDEMYEMQRYPHRMNQAEPTGGQIARVDPTDKLLLDSLRKGEIGDPNSPRIRKAIIDLERKIYNEGRASSMEGALMAEMPRRIRGSFRPAGVFGSPPPNFDSPYMDEQIRRGFVPMTPPLPRGAGGPQLPGFV